MALEDITDQYITYESRLASFHKSSRKRGSAANGRGAKALNWPHKNIAPASLARAGLFYHPSADNPDNVICFLCHKGLDGWEAGDDPLIEHLKHSPECGWAIVAAIEAEVGDYAQEDPSLPYMRDARKATFAGRWPHDGKKGWKCKTKQLVDAGWKYTPTSDSDDMATCVYCQLALDGWEPGDKPLDEHFNRSPECAFFALLNEMQGAKKSSRAKGSRVSKASRLSVATVASEAASVTETAAGPEDSVLTTSSTVAQGSKKTKGKKTTTGKSRKVKTKKGETEGNVEAEEVEPVQPALEEAAPKKPQRGKKRGSAAMEDSSMNASEASAPKKRATRTRGSTAISSSVLEHDDTQMTDTAPKKALAKKKSRAKATRKVSATSTASTASVASLRAPPGTFPDDDEIERQLEAELGRPLSEDEEITVDSDSERRKGKAKKVMGSKAPKQEEICPQESADYAMFNPTPAGLDDDEVEDELKALQAEMEMDEPLAVTEPPKDPEPEPEPEPERHQELYVPKKGRKAAATRKVSKQTKSKKAKSAPPPIEEDELAAPVPEEVPMIPEPESEDPLHEDSIASTGTVVKKSTAARLSDLKRGRGRPSKTSLASQEPSEVMELIQPPAESSEPSAPKRGRGRPSKASLASQASEPEEKRAAGASEKRGRGRPPKKSAEAIASPEVRRTQERPEQVDEQANVHSRQALETTEAHGPVVSFEDPRSPAAEELTSPQPPSSGRHLAEPSTPGRMISPAPSARQAAISPSQSPQSSNAENEPPSSRHAHDATKRVALVPVAVTPSRGSPSKRNVIAGLKSSTPWTAVDVDAVFTSPNSSPNKENGADRFLKKGQTLTSPEKRMTVEEWIQHNAAEAEKKLKHECEAMVSRFENEGTKAMHVLEGLVAE